MAMTCRGCKYLSAFGALCILGREKSRCREKRMREDQPVTAADLMIRNRIDALVAAQEAAGHGATQSVAPGS